MVQDKVADAANDGLQGAGAGAAQHIGPDALVREGPGHPLQPPDDPPEEKRQKGIDGIAHAEHPHRSGILHDAPDHVDQVRQREEHIRDRPDDAESPGSSLDGHDEGCHDPAGQHARNEAGHILPQHLRFKHIIVHGGKEPVQQPAAPPVPCDLHKPGSQQQAPVFLNLPDQRALHRLSFGRGRHGPAKGGRVRFPLACAGGDSFLEPVPLDDASQHAQDQRADQDGASYILVGQQPHQHLRGLIIVLEPIAADVCNKPAAEGRHDDIGIEIDLRADRTYHRRDHNGQHDNRRELQFPGRQQQHHHQEKC